MKETGNISIKETDLLTEERVAYLWDTGRPNIPKHGGKESKGEKES